MSEDDARPVRTFENSLRAWLTALTILSSASLSTRSSSSLMRSEPPAAGRSPNQRTDRLTQEYGPHVALGHEVEHDDRHVVLHAERHGGGVHRPEPAVDDVDVADLGDERGLRVRAGIVGVDALDARVRAP